MNKLDAKISSITKNDSLHLVELDASGANIIMIGLELPLTFKIGGDTSIMFKPSSVVLAKNFYGELSMSNRIECVVKEIDSNEILAEVLLSSKCGEFYSLITKNSLERMSIKTGDSVTAMIKATEVSLGEI